MPRTKERARRRAPARLLGLLMLGPCCAGCAAMTQDVDAYYRQMAYNYQEAADKAKRDETSLENQVKILAMTGAPATARKAQRKIERIKSWEEHCLQEKKRFEKAAEWMEAHFHLERAKIPGEQPVTQASYSRETEASASPLETPGSATGGR